MDHNSFSPGQICETIRKKSITRIKRGNGNDDSSRKIRILSRSIHTRCSTSHLAAIMLPAAEEWAELKTIESKTNIVAGNIRDML